ncbi:MAG: hypothetical protein ACJAZC_002032, partial [Cryomorphaceae bacterium]
FQQKQSAYSGLGFFHFRKTSSKLGLGKFRIIVQRDSPPLRCGDPEGWGFQQKQSAYSGLGFFHFRKTSSKLGLPEMKKAITTSS